VLVKGSDGRHSPWNRTACTQDDEELFFHRGLLSVFHMKRRAVFGLALAPVVKTGS
jgi:hypothetical protein